MRVWWAGVRGVRGWRGAGVVTLLCWLPPPALAPSPARAPAPLLLLREACPAPPAVLTAIAATAAARRPPLTVLSYEDTCSPGWELRATRHALATLAGGGAVAGAGWEEAGACAALRALGGARGCGREEARAAALAHVARALRWRRARLPPPPSPCARALSAALLHAGVTVRIALLHADTTCAHEVAVACESEELWRRGGGGGAVVVRPRAPPPPRLLPPSLVPATAQQQIYLYDKPPSYNLTGDDMFILHGPFTSTVAPLESDSELEQRKAAWKAYEEAAMEVTAAPGDHGSNEFVLTERLEDGSERFVVTISVTLSQAHSDAGPVQFDVSVKEGVVSAEWWWARCGGAPDEAPEERGRSSGVALAALVTAVGGAGVLGALCWAGWRRLGARAAAEVELRAADFTFPPDERRLGDGMEVVSCWLQRLHELAAPSPALPPTLPPALLPAPPSAPSSTPSVNKAVDQRPRYKGETVHLRALCCAPPLELRRAARDLLFVMQRLRHENLNPFLGCLCETRPALVWDYCGRGSLEDVLRADDIALDWTFRLSLLTDAARGLRYLHASPLRVHGRLSSRNCVVDSRWVLRLTDYGAADLTRVQGLPVPPRRARDLLWSAPELLREWRKGNESRPDQPADVFSFAIIMQEVIVRGEPYCMLSLTPDEILEKLCRPPPLIRPSVSMGAAPPDAVNVMRQCWAEAPDLRPTANALDDIFRRMHRGRKINIVDSMFEMLEKYSNNLEELIKERTEQLDMEKKRTEQLLNRMLPRSVAERLLAGQRVQPEEFAEVSVYFSDIVGFTELAARSTPVQVVDLLNDLYTSFDATIEQYDVYKVETIGDAYMVVSGAPVRARSHAESVGTMALHLLHVAGRFRVRHQPQRALHLRIGLHSGPVCAAVVGLTMPRYCLFGDTVNTASRMESTGAAWRIHLSADTARLLSAAGGYRLRSRGLTQVKGKGAMHTYWLLGKDGFDKPLPVPPPLESEETLVEIDGESEVPFENGIQEAAHADVKENGYRPATPATRRANRYAWQRSGAVSADSSPGRGAGGGVRRQWSLERGDARDQSGPLPAPAAPRYRTRAPPPPAAQRFPSLFF